jgi:PST family polysaccharide transporter
MTIPVHRIDEPAVLEMPPASQERALADLKRKSVRGGTITLASQGARVFIQIASTGVLARLLTPNDYGVIAMVLSVTTLAEYLRDLGLSTASIQKQNLTHALQTNLFWINVATGLALTAALAATSPLIAGFYHQPQVLWVTVAMSASFLINSLAAQSGALLARNLWFGRQAVATISGALTTLAVSIALALKGFTYWSLVWGQLAGTAITAGSLFFLSPFRPGLPRRGTGVRDLLKFGAHITAFDFVNYFHRNLDTILIGRFCGAGLLGLYNRAYGLLMFPMNNLWTPINTVAFPAMSRLQDQPTAYRNYYQRVTGLLALLSMPCTAFLFVASGPVVRLVLGAQWAGVTPIFSVLATVAFVQPVISLWGMVLLSQGMGRRYLHIGILTAAFSAVGFLAGIRWGPVGVATGYAIATYVTSYPILAWAFRGTSLRLRDFWASVSRPMISSLCAAGISVAPSGWLRGYEAAVEIVALGAIFVPTFMLALWCLPGGRLEIQRALELLPARLRLKWAAQ